MPNWVNHNLTITGPETERKRFMAECFSQANDETNFDFDKLVPEPEHIEDEGNERCEASFISSNDGGTPASKISGLVRLAPRKLGHEVERLLHQGCA